MVRRSLAGVLAEHDPAIVRPVERRAVHAAIRSAAQPHGVTRVHVAFRTFQSVSQVPRVLDGSVAGGVAARRYIVAGMPGGAGLL